MEQDFYRIGETRAWVERVRKFPDNTCPSSRHAQMIAEALIAGEHMSAIHEEPQHGGSSILSAVAALYETRTLRDVLLKLHGLTSHRFSPEVVEQCWEMLRADAEKNEREWEAELAKARAEREATNG